MLVDVNRWDPTMRMILAVLGGGQPERIGRGMYTRCGFNFENAIHRPDVVGFDERTIETFPEYGVVDSPAQFVELFGPAVEASPRHYAVGFTEVRRAEQPLEGGWRWHKWGEYYGVHKPQYEYLHDEPDIESVFTFSVVQLQGVNGADRPAERGNGS